MSSPELFISRARAKRYRARGGGLRDEWRGRRGGGGGRRGNGQPARGRQDEEEDVGETRRRDDGGGVEAGGRQGRLKRGMKRQTAADEIHNLDPMRSLYLV